LDLNDQIIYDKYKVIGFDKVIEKIIVNGYHFKYKKNNKKCKCRADNPRFIGCYSGLIFDTSEEADICYSSNFHEHTEVFDEKIFEPYFDKFINYP
jgi:hypothetical protein